MKYSPPGFLLPEVKLLYQKQANIDLISMYSGLHSLSIDMATGLKRDTHKQRPDAWQMKRSSPFKRAKRKRV